MSGMQHYAQYLVWLAGQPVEPAPAFPWASASKCSSASDPLWADVKRKVVSELLPFTDSYFAKSTVRSNGYALWDAVVATGVPAHREPKETYADDVKALSSINEGYIEYLWRHTAGGLKSGYIVDLTRTQNGDGILELAHIRAHALGDLTPKRSGWWHTYASTSLNMAEAIAELSVASALNLPVDLNARNILPYGIRALPSNRIGLLERRPTLQLPTSTAINDVDQVLAYICVSVEPGHDPVAITDDHPGKRDDADFWSYQPKRMMLMGWETAPGVCARSLCTPRRFGWESLKKRALAYTVPAVDLMPMTAFDGYLRDAEVGMPITENYRPISWWLGNQHEIAGFDATPKLPCLSCVLFHPSVNNGLRMPAKWRFFSVDTPEVVKKMKGQEEDSAKVLDEHRNQIKLALSIVDKEKLPDDKGERARYRKHNAANRKRWQKRIKEVREKWRLRSKQ